MISVLDEILCIRQGRYGQIDRKNHNRYRVVFLEEDGQKTAYYFSVPIYKIGNGKIVDHSFSTEGSAFCYEGSNVKITVDNSIRMENEDGRCCISLPEGSTEQKERELLCGETRVFPTANGVLLMLRCSKNVSARLRLDGGDRFYDVRANKTSFSLMREGFQPLVTLSTAGVFSKDRKHLMPAEICYSRTQDRAYDIEIRAAGNGAAAQDASDVYFWLECNMYEPKLFQDVCVRSRDPKENNTYGATGFLGRTDLLGEEWLYSRMDYGKTPELLGIPLKKAVLHIPRHGGRGGAIGASEVVARFCSFGSTWENKVSSKAKELSTRENGNYLSLDLTETIVDPKSGFLKSIHGLIFRPRPGETEYSLISTADSHFAPQILEVSYL